MPNLSSFVASVMVLLWYPMPLGLIYACLPERFSEFGGVGRERYIADCWPLTNVGLTTNLRKPESSFFSQTRFILSYLTAGLVGAMQLVFNSGPESPCSSLPIHHHEYSV
jgi:hypothetical protein